MDDVETREVRSFSVIAKELSLGPAAERLGTSRLPLSWAMWRLEHRLGVKLMVPDQRPVVLTQAGGVLLVEARLVLVSKAGAFHELLRDLCAARRDALEVEAALCEVGQQCSVLRAGRAEVAIVPPFRDVHADLDTAALLPKGRWPSCPRPTPWWAPATCSWLTSPTC